MSITPQDLLSCGEALCKGTTEAELRAAMSRAYYGSYHSVRAWYEPILPGSNVGPKGGVHQTFVNELRNPAPENPAEVRTLSKLIGAQLDVARNQRHIADYDLSNATVDQLQAQNLYHLAVSIVKRTSPT